MVQSGRKATGSFNQPAAAVKTCLCTSRPSNEPAFLTLNEGQVVEYEEVSNRGRTAAENLRVSR